MNKRLKTTSPILIIVLTICLLLPVKPQLFSASANDLEASQTTENQTVSTTSSEQDTVTNAPENTVPAQFTDEQKETPKEAVQVLQPEVIEMPPPAAKYFSFVCSDAEFKEYNPISVCKKVYDLNDISVPVITRLNELYSPYLTVSESQTVEPSWSEITSASFFIPGDLLVSDDFSIVGIYIGKDQVFCLHDGEIDLPAKYKYFNKDFQTKTIKTVW